MLNELVVYLVRVRVRVWVRVRVRVRVRVERVGRVPEHLEHVPTRGREDRVVGVVVVGLVPPPLPPVPHQLDVRVVALARPLRAAGLLVREVDAVVRLAELVQPVGVRVGRRLAAAVRVAR